MWGRLGREVRWAALQRPLFGSNLRASFTHPVPTFFLEVVGGWGGVGEEALAGLGAWQETRFGGKVDLAIDADSAVRAQGMGQTATETEVQGQRIAPAQTKPEFQKP